MRVFRQPHRAVAQIDVFVSLALVAGQNNYCKPKINESGVIDIKGGRHPVVEKMIVNDMFIDNDAYRAFERIVQLSVFPFFVFFQSSFESFHFFASFVPFFNG